MTAGSARINHFRQKSLNIFEAPILIDNAAKEVVDNGA
jgi:hypothetical protein